MSPHPFAVTNAILGYESSDKNGERVFLPKKIAVILDNYYLEIMLAFFQLAYLTNFAWSCIR